MTDFVLFMFLLRRHLTVFFPQNLSETQITFYLHKRLLSKILEELVKKLTAGCQHRFMGSELVSCKRPETHINVWVFISQPH